MMISYLRDVKEKNIERIKGGLAFDWKNEPATTTTTNLNLGRNGLFMNTTPLNKQEKRTNVLTSDNWLYL
jgi:hypothetical protein